MDGWFEHSTERDRTSPGACAAQAPSPEPPIRGERIGGPGAPARGPHEIRGFRGVGARGPAPRTGARAFGECVNEDRRRVPAPKGWVKRAARWCAWAPRRRLRVGGSGLSIRPRWDPGARAWLALAVVCGAGLAVSTSRSGWLGALAGICILAVFAAGPKRLRGVIAGAALALTI